jgi:hypothetical protein
MLEVRNKVASEILLAWLTGDRDKFNWFARDGRRLSRPAAGRQQAGNQPGLHVICAVLVDELFGLGDLYIIRSKIRCIRL